VGAGQCGEPVKAALGKVANREPCEGCKNLQIQSCQNMGVLGKTIWNSAVEAQDTACQGFKLDVLGRIMHS